MKPLYETILSSTKSGKQRFPKWSKRYFHDQYKQAANDFCKFYDIGGSLKEQIKDLFYDLVLRDIESFNFIQDFDAEEKIIEGAKISKEEFQDKKAFNIKGIRVYLIIKTDTDTLYIWQRNTQIFEKIYYSELSKYLLQ